MREVLCPSCHRTNQLEVNNAIPDECSYCFEVFPKDAEIADSGTERAKSEMNVPQVGEIDGLVLTYQINEAEIRVAASGRVVLGRKAFGSEILSRILFNGNKVISREHCSIDFRDGAFYIKDEGSRNGTFYSVRKVSCRDVPQLIEPNSIIYLGEEPFFARIVRKEVSSDDWDRAALPESDGAPQAAEKNVNRLRCNNCGHEIEENPCPHCDTYNKWVNHHHS